MMRGPVPSFRYAPYAREKKEMTEKKQREVTRSQELIAIRDFDGMTELGWQISTMDKADWVKAGTMLVKVDEARQWWVGDWYNGSPVNNRDEVVRDVGMKTNWVKVIALTCRKIPLPWRRKTLTFSHHREISSLPTDMIVAALDWAELNDANVMDTRDHVRELKYGKKRVETTKIIEDAWTDAEDQKWNDSELGQAVTANRFTHPNLVATGKETGKVVDIEASKAGDPGWSNPFIPGKDGTAEDCLELFKWYLKYKPSLLDRLHELEGKILVCSCDPSPCHGHHLERLVNSIAEEDPPAPPNNFKNMKPENEEGEQNGDQE